MDEKQVQEEIDKYIKENRIQKRDNYHCVLIAKNYDGVIELNELSSRAFKRDGHFYYNPRISFEELFLCTHSNTEPCSENPIAFIPSVSA